MARKARVVAEELPTELEALPSEAAQQVRGGGENDLRPEVGRVCESTLVNVVGGVAIKTTCTTTIPAPRQ